MDPQDFGFLDPDPYSRGKKNFFTPKSELLKKERLKKFPLMNGSSKFRIKISEKKIQ